MHLGGLAFDLKSPFCRRHALSLCLSILHAGVLRSCTLLMQHSAGWCSVSPLFCLSFHPGSFGHDGHHVAALPGEAPLVFQLMSVSLQLLRQASIHGKHGHTDDVHVETEEPVVSSYGG